jgi:hypothetical protein
LYTNNDDSDYVSEYLHDDDYFFDGDNDDDSLGTDYYFDDDYINEEDDDDDDDDDDFNEDELLSTIKEYVDINENTRQRSINQVSPDATLQPVVQRYEQLYLTAGMTGQCDPQLNPYFVTELHKFRSGQKLVFIQGKCGVNKLRKGNHHLGDVNLMSGEGLTDKCASVLAYRCITSLLPDDSYFLCNVRPHCILQDDMVHCKDCDEKEMNGMIHQIRLLTNFVKEVGGSVYYINLGGGSTSSIGKQLIARQIIPSKNVLFTGFHMCLLVAKNQRKPYAEQQLDVTDFVDSLDWFLTDKFELERHSILMACIKNPKLRFVVDIDRKTRMETEASRASRKQFKYSRQRQRYHERINAMSSEEKEEFLSRQRQRKQEYINAMSSEEKEEFRSRHRQWYQERINAMSSEEKEEFVRRRSQRFHERINAMSIDEKEEYLSRRRQRYHERKNAMSNDERFVTDVAVVVTDRDILITTGGNCDKIPISLKEYRDCVKDNAQAYHSATNDAKRNIAIAIVKHFTDQNRRFFVPGKGEQVMLLSNDGAIATVQRALAAVTSHVQRKEKEAKLKASQFVTDVAAVVTDRDILIPRNGKSTRKSYIEYRDYLKANAQAYHSAIGNNAKQKIVIAFVKHFTDQNRRFFGYGEGGRIMLLSNDGAVTIVKNAFKAMQKSLKANAKKSST